jgi:putative ABC transport system permease protein
MMLIIKIAWRNIQRHRGKSIIIGVILFAGALLMTVGNGIIAGMDAGLQKNVVEGFSGDIVLVPDEHESENVFLEMGGKTMEPLNNYKSIDTVLRTLPYVKKWLPMGKNTAMLLNEDGGLAKGEFVLGVDMKQYNDFFGGNLKLLEGRMLQPDERGILVPTGMRKLFGEVYNILFTPEGCAPDTATLSDPIKKHLSTMNIHNSVVLMGMGTDNTSTDIRAPVRGIIKYRSLNMIWGNFPIMDIESYRECQGYFAADAKANVVDSSTQKLLAAGSGSDADLFSTDMMVTTKQASSKTMALAEGSLKRSAVAAAPKTVDHDAGTFNLVLLRIDKGRNLYKTVADLNKIFIEKKLGIKAVHWQKAIGTVGSLAMLIKASLIVFVLMLFFVAIIIIINTLSMAALERTTEIGMMRAVGAQKGFIRSMFLGETAVLSAVFGGAGIAVGIIVIRVIAALHFTTDNDMLELLYGGDTFHPLLAGGDVVLSIVMLAIVTLVAVVYPIIIAGNITPLDAISRE